MVDGAGQPEWFPSRLQRHGRPQWRHEGIFFKIEGGFKADTGASAQGGRTWGRATVVGLSGGFGSVSVGRQPDPLYDLSYLGSAIVPFGLIVNNVHSLNLDRLGGERTEKLDPLGFPEHERRPRQRHLWPG
ncbi:porin [Undibacterium arcticum]